MKWCYSSLVYVSLEKAKSCRFYLDNCPSSSTFPPPLLWQTITVMICHLATSKFFPHCSGADLPMVELPSRLYVSKASSGSPLPRIKRNPCSLEFKPLSAVAAVCPSSLPARALFQEPGRFFCSPLPLCLSASQSLFLGRLSFFHSLPNLVPL